MKEKVVVNGMATEEAQAPMDDRGFTLGDGLFETIPIYHGRPFLLTEHLARLAQGAKLIGIEPDLAEKKVAFAIAELASANHVSRGVARLTLTRGLGPRGYSSHGAGPARWYLTVRPYDPPDRKKAEGGYKLAISPNPVDSSSVLRRIKSVSALERVLAIGHAQKTGADEALSITHEGLISSLQSANLFWVKDGTLYTPGLDCAILPGVTRKAVLALAAKEGIKAVEGKFTLEHMRQAEEMFATNSLIEIMPISQLDTVAEFGGIGPVTNRLHKAYQRML